MPVYFSSGHIGAFRSRLSIRRTLNYNQPSLFYQAVLCIRASSSVSYGRRCRTGTFVLAELLKLASWSGGHFEFHHFRDRYDNEVDIVIEDQDRHVVGIEVKSGATVTSGDFSGLRKLAAACGKRFTLGLVLYDHDTLVPFGERLFAAPVLTSR